MWCERCAQDVPGIPALEDGTFSCPRCAEILLGVDGRGRPDPETATADPIPLVLPSAPPSDDTWDMDDQLRHIGRVLATPRAEGSTPRADRKRIRLDGAHGLPPSKGDSPIFVGRKSGQSPAPPSGKDRPSSVRRKSPQPPVESDSLLGTLTWTALALGTTAFVCGGVLLGWSIATGRSELWTIGTPIALGGQIALLVGLVLQLDRLWRDSRRATRRLETVDEQLNELKTTTSLLGTTHGPSGAFYAHLAGGASPDILLSDLKSQIDLLATRLADE